MDLLNFIREHTKVAGDWAYKTNDTRAGFQWVAGSADDVPFQPGVYFLMSHDSSRLQKIGKAEGAKGLNQRFHQYTSLKSIKGKIQKDKTDLLWYSKMTDPTSGLFGERINVHWYITKPAVVKLPHRDINLELEAHWARSLERELNLLALSQNLKMELSGNQV